VALALKRPDLGLDLKPWSQGDLFYTVFWCDATIWTVSFTTTTTVLLFSVIFFCDGKWDGVLPDWL